MTKLLEFLFVYIYSLLSNKQFMRKQNGKKFWGQYWIMEDFVISFPIGISFKNLFYAFK